MLKLWLFRGRLRQYKKAKNFSSSDMFQWWGVFVYLWIYISTSMLTPDFNCKRLQKNIVDSWKETFQSENIMIVTTGNGAKFNRCVIRQGNFKCRSINSKNSISKPVFRIWEMFVYNFNLLTAVAKSRPSYEESMNYELLNVGLDGKKTEK